MNPMRRADPNVHSIPGWVRDAVFYQIFPDRFARGPLKAPPVDPRLNLEPWDAPPTPEGYKGGNLPGIVERLDYLGGLGITALYLNPVFLAASNHRYNTCDYYRIDPLLGGEAALRDLIDKAHQRGIRIILDGSFNHVGRGFFQFQDILENGPSSPWVNWFRIEGWPLSPYDATRPANYRSWYGNRELPELNHHNPAVREFLIRAAEHWTGLGIDGWRFDSPDRVGAAGFWEALRRRVRAVNPEAYLVGEILHEAPAWLGSRRLDAVQNYQFFIATLMFAGGARLVPAHLKPSQWEPLKPIDAAGYAGRLERLLGQYSWETNLVQLNFLENHDTARLITVFGNDRERFELAHLLLFTAPGVPCIFYGSEVGVKGGLDPLCRAAFPAEAAWDRQRLGRLRELIRIRRSLMPLRVGDFRILLARRHTLVFARKHAGEMAVVAVNAGDAGDRAHIDLASAGLWAKGREGPGLAAVPILFGGGEAACRREGQRPFLTLTLPPRQGVICSLQVP